MPVRNAHRWASLTEGPHSHEGRLLVSVSIHIEFLPSVWMARRIVATIPDQPLGLGFMPDGLLLVVSMRDRSVASGARRHSRRARHLSTLAPWHLNDMLVDNDGRAWVGNFGLT